MKRLFIVSLSCLLFCSAALGQNDATDEQKFLNLIAKAYQLILEEKYDDALKLCDEAAKMRPTDNRPYAMSGLAHLEQWKLEEASALLEIATKFSPKNPVLHFYKARADRFNNDRDKALVSVREALKLKSDYAEAYLLLGELLTEPSERRAAFQKAVSLDPGLPTSYSYFGMKIDGNFKDIKAAEEVYRTVIEADPNNTQGRGRLGRL